MQKIIEVTFYSDWHISSGIGDSYKTDAILMRDVDGFPYIPGKIIKGALREGSQRLGLCRQDLANAEKFFWGSNISSLESNECGHLRVSSAFLPIELKEQIFDLPTKERLIADLIIIHYQTALTKEGLVKKSSLRSFECGMAGLKLYATLEVPTFPNIDDAWLATYFGAVCAAVKNIGQKKSRGLGRCQFCLQGQQRPPLLPHENLFLKNNG